MELQLDWDIDRLQADFANGPDTAYVMARLSVVPPEVTAAGAPHRVLEIAAAEAVHSCKINLRGAETYVVEPSEVMLARARERMAEHGATLSLIRGIAETLPFRDHTFDRVLLDSAIDHLGDPELAIREMTRVTKPDGRLVIGFVNYEGISVRLSRGAYRIARRLGMASPAATYFWDSPVPLEHTFECTYSVIQQLCAPYLELDRAFGVSMGWMVPGWAALLKRLPRERALALMQRLDRLAYRRPRRADFVMSVWRPHPSRGAAAVSAAPPARDRQVLPTDLFYRSKAGPEAEFWARRDFHGGFFGLGRPGSGDTLDRMSNQAYTGDPRRSWMDDLIARGPFRVAAALGCDEGGYEGQWLSRGGSEQLDVYELSADVIRTVRSGLGLGWLATHGPRRRARFIRADLNFVHLPVDRYDVIWSSGCLHHIVNLEHLLAEVERALRPGGLFALRDYVGERRLQFSAQRLARINAVLEQVPPRYRRIESVTPVRIEGVSPFCAVRSEEILPLAEARFDVVYKSLGGALFPLTFGIDLAGMEREAPEALARIQEAEREALRDPSLRPSVVYAVFRRRGDKPHYGAAP
jgi:ubiquinone/menaquinone biosynthesis C-methylase UbiE